MAARSRKLSIDDRTKLRIRTSQLINRLQDHVFGEVELVSTQVTAALALLKKTLPDLTSTELKGDDNHPLQHHVKISFVKTE